MTRQLHLNFNRVLLLVSKVLLLPFLIIALFIPNAQSTFERNNTYSKGLALSFANNLFEGKGPNFGRWRTPIIYRVAGLNDPLQQKLLSSVLSYYSNLTGIDVVPHEGGKINFLLILTKSYTEPAYNPEIQKIFMRPNETVDDFVNRLSAADKKTGFSTQFAKRYLDDDGFTVGYYVLDNPEVRKDFPFNYFLELTSQLFLDYTANDLVIPSIFNKNAPAEGYWKKSPKRLPMLDEFLIKEVYRIKGPKISDGGYRNFIRNVETQMLKQQ